MYIYIYIYVYIYVYIYMYIYKMCMNVYIMCMNVYIYTYIYIYPHEKNIKLMVKSPSFAPSHLGPKCLEAMRVLSHDDTTEGEFSMDKSI